MGLKWEGGLEFKKVKTGITLHGIQGKGMEVLAYDKCSLSA